MLSVRSIIAYATPAIALAVVGVPVFVYLPQFYSDVVGVPVGVVGLLLMVARALDGITDPLMGRFSDQLRTRWGRRRPVMVAAAVPLAASVLWVYFPPGGMTPTTGAVWFGTGMVAMFLFWTAVTVPYEALGPEVTSDYDERTTLLGTREAFLMIGTLLAVGTPAVLDVAFGLTGSGEDERWKFGLVGMIYAPFILVTVAICVAFVRERAPTMQPPPLSAWQSVRELLSNQPFRVLLSSFTVSAFGSILPAVLIPYFVTYYLRSDHLNFFLVGYFIVAIGTLPLWALLSRRVGKKACWLASMAVNTGAFAFVPLLSVGNEVGYAIIVGMSALGGGAVLAFPAAMQADVIDYDELLTGHRREGQFIGIWLIARKLAGAVGTGAALAAMDAAGYVPNALQTDSVLTTLLWMYVGVPVLCNTVAFAIALRYPIGRDEHEQVRLGIAALAAGQSAVDPLTGARLTRQRRDRGARNGNAEPAGASDHL
ncbi:MAG: GPH family glycoside/pentoside/hexuronide:cation symporter [Myxococcota bacterium]|jgi:GPH family glycoside/pentoside/hexuronide:cation symporter